MMLFYHIFTGLSMESKGFVRGCHNGRNKSMLDNNGEDKFGNFSNHRSSHQTGDGLVVISRKISQARDKIVSNHSEREVIPQTNPHVAMPFL